MNRMNRFDFYLTSGQTFLLRKLSNEAEVSVSELIRRAIDYCLQEHIICNLLPLYESGSISVGGAKFLDRGNIKKEY